MNLKFAAQFRELCSVCCTLDAQKWLIHITECVYFDKLPSPTPWPLAATTPSLLCVFCFVRFPIEVRSLREIRRYLSFCAWLFSFHRISSRFIQVAINAEEFPSFKVHSFHCVCVCVIQMAHFLYLCLLWVCECVCVCVCVCVYTWDNFSISKEKRKCSPIFS